MSKKGDAVMKSPSKTQIRTRKNLIEAFMTVYRTKTIDRVSVRDITDAAGYHRSTFYLYFKDVYDLADAAEDQVLTELNAEIQKILSEEENIGPDGFLIRLSSVFAAEHADRLYLFSELPSFRRKLKRTFEPNFTRVVGRGRSRKEFDYIISLLTAIMLHNIRYYHQNRDSFTTAEMLDTVRRILLPGIEGYMSAVPS
ncbi:MAG: TetR/AcrR family transcriptional regulator [Bacillota bacterium]